MENLDSYQAPKPDNNLPLAIISTVLGLCSPCCIGLIIGIISIVFSTQVNSKYNAGDYAGSNSAAKTSKILAFVAIGLAVLGIVIVFIQINAVGGWEAYLEQYQELLEQYQ
jgi:cytochrome c biogenesis protein CcdA